MKLLFVRHAIAEEREGFAGDDLERPLTQRGIKKAKIAFSTLAKFYPKPSLIITSEALRAIQTAGILSSAYNNGVDSIETHLLNPSTGIKNFTEALTPFYEKNKTIAIVGHEPDFSNIISKIISDCEVSLDIKKASVIEVEVDKEFKGRLNFMIPPKILALMAK